MLIPKIIALFWALISKMNFFSKRKNTSTVYLTFDDGILKGTNFCVETCITTSTKASFFIVGSHIRGYKDKNVLNRIKREKSLLCIANHSYSHANENYISFYKNENEALKDFIYSQNFLGLSEKIVRLPGNPAWCNKSGVKASALVWPLVSLLSEHRFNIIGWDWELKIPKQPIDNPKQLANTLLKDFLTLVSSRKSYTENHYVILLHDWSFQNTNAELVLLFFIHDLKAQNYLRLSTIDKYPNLY